MKFINAFKNEEVNDIKCKIDALKIESIAFCNTQEDDFFDVYIGGNKYYIAKDEYGSYDNFYDNFIAFLENL